MKVAAELLQTTNARAIAADLPVPNTSDWSSAASAASPPSSARPTVSSRREPLAVCCGLAAAWCFLWSCTGRSVSDADEWSVTVNISDADDSSEAAVSTVIGGGAPASAHAHRHTQQQRYTHVCAKCLSLIHSIVSSFIYYKIVH